MHYVAIGDSFTEGVGDEDAGGRPRGWADRLAAGLVATGDEPVHYANLAVRGKLLGHVVGEQLTAALALSPRPTLLTLNGGGNDMLRPRADMAALAALTASAVRRCLDAGVDVLLISGADPSEHLPLGSVVRRRGTALTAGVAGLGALDGVTFVDMFHDAELRHRRYWSDDRLHLNPAGHQRVADRLLAALGRPPGPPGDLVELPRPAGARYYREHVLPWLGRRLRGRSSGDGRPPKYPDWVTPQAC